MPMSVSTVAELRVARARNSSPTSDKQEKIHLFVLESIQIDAGVYPESY
jgi:hypothetical protein